MQGQGSVVSAAFVDDHMQEWCNKWLLPLSMTDGTTPSTRAYLELIFRGSRLWLMSYGLHAPAASDAERRVSEQECLRAALESARLAVTEYSKHPFFWVSDLFCFRLIGRCSNLHPQQFMPNVIVSVADVWPRLYLTFLAGQPPILTYAAVLALQVSACLSLHGSWPVQKLKHDGLQLMRPSNLASEMTVLGLLANLGILLERVGTTPPERLGTATAYGRKVQYIVKARLTQALQAYSRQSEQAASLPQPFDNHQQLGDMTSNFGSVPLLDPHRRTTFGPTGMPYFPEPDHFFQQLIRESEQGFQFVR